jgi:hypothetical protein
LNGTIANADIANDTIVATTKLSATGTKNANTVLRGNNTWGAAPTTLNCTLRNGNFPVASGNVQQSLNCNAGEIATGGGCYLDHLHFTWNWPSAVNEWTCYKSGGATNMYIRVICCEG